MLILASSTSLKRRGERVKVLSSKMLLVDCYEWVGKLAGFASVQMGGKPGWVSLVHKYPGC